MKYQGLQLHICYVLRYLVIVSDREKRTHNAGVEGSSPSLSTIQSKLRASFFGDFRVCHFLCPFRLGSGPERAPPRVLCQVSGRKMRAG